MDSDEEDPVVEEVEVYLSQRLAHNLYLYQYPVRPAHMTYDDVMHLGARIKPGQQRVELELGINTLSSNYAQSKGEMIARNVDGAYPKTYSGDSMDKQVLTSVPSGIDTSRYIIGNYANGELHVTPLRGIVQLRPGFGYLDEADARAQKDSEEGIGEEDEAKPVTVRFARRETDEARARRIASYEYVNRRREEERWISMTYHQMDSPTAAVERNKLVAEQMGDVPEFHMAPTNYLTKLIPDTTQEEHKAPPLPSNVLSLAELKTMSLSDQIKALMLNAKVLRFAQLMSLLPQGTDMTSALRCLQQVAMLIQGCWVVKSDVLYPRDTYSANSGVPAETLCRGRDYVMWRFTQSRYVVRKDIASVIKLPAEDVKDILEQMARLKISKGWEFLLPADSDFLHRHPEVSQRQAMLWDAKFTQLSSTLRISRADLDRKAKSDELLASPEKSKRRRTSSTRSRTKSGGMSDLSDSDETARGERSRRNSGSVRSRKNSGMGSEDTQRHRSASITEFNVRIEMSGDEGGGGDAENGPQGADETPDNQNGEVSNSSALKQELCRFIREKLAARYVLTLTDVKNLLALKMAQCAPGHILSTGVSEKLLESTLVDVGGIAIPNADEPTFVLGKAGDSYDAIRESLIEILLAHKTFKSTLLKRKLEEKLGEPPLDVDLKKVLREYCVTKGSQWHLKSFKETS